MLKPVSLPCVNFCFHPIPGLMKRLLLICFLFTFAACKNSSQYKKEEGSKKFDQALELAGHKIDSGFVGQADTLVNQVFQNLHAAPYDSLRWLAFSYNIYLQQGRYSDVIGLTDSVIRRLSSKVSDPELRRIYADALFAKGDALYMLGVYPAGLRAYYLAQQTGLKYQDECVMADFAFRLANINFKQERYSEAATHYYKSLQRIFDCQLAGFSAAAYHQVLLNNIGICLTRAGLTDSALFVFDLARQQVAIYAKQYSVRSNYWKIAAQIINANKAEALIIKKDFNQAEELLTEALRIPEYRKLEPLDALLSKLKLADVYLKQNRYQEAASLLKEMKGSPLLITQARASFQWYILWGQVQEVSGRYKEAAEAMQLALKYREQFLEERKRYLMLNLDENIRLMNQADRNDVLIAKIQRNNLVIIITLMAMLLILLGGAFLYLNFRKSSQYVSLLTVLNERIKRQNERQERTLEELRLSNLEKDRIMQMVAHDLRSPVASIYWLANVMLEDDNLNEEQRNNMELILLASNNSLSLTKDMLEAVSLLQTNELSRSECSVRKLLQQQMQLQQSSLEAKGLQVSVSMPDSEVTALVDADKFSQVISNLLTNAIKFSLENGVIDITLSESQTHLQLVIRDHGIGLLEGQEEKIFEAFSEARRNGTRGEKSYGLGLSIARRIIVLHGGNIFARNHPEGGAVFTVNLPKKPLMDTR